MPRIHESVILCTHLFCLFLKFFISFFFFGPHIMKYHMYLIEAQLLNHSSLPNDMSSVWEIIVLFAALNLSFIIWNFLPHRDFFLIILFYFVLHCVHFYWENSTQQDELCYNEYSIFSVTLFKSDVNILWILSLSGEYVSVQNNKCISGKRLFFPGWFVFVPTFQRKSNTKWL